MRVFHLLTLVRHNPLWRHRLVAFCSRLEEPEPTSEPSKAGRPDPDSLIAGSLPDVHSSVVGSRHSFAATGKAENLQFKTRMGLAKADLTGRPMATAICI